MAAYAHPREYGWNLIQTDAYAKAEKCFRKVVSMRQDPYCEAMLGWCELQKGNCHSARHRLQSAIEQGFDEDWVRAALEQCQLQENS